LVDHIMKSRPHPEMGYRSVMGIMRLGKAVGDARLEAACRRDLHFGTCTYKSIQSILQHHLEQQPLEPELPLNSPNHQNVRGKDPPTPIPTMIYSQTLEKLRALRLEGLAQALEEQRRQANVLKLDFEERLALLVERQWTWKENRAMAARLKRAQFKFPNACLEDIDYALHRQLKRAQVEQLRAGEWVQNYRNCLIIGPTGIGQKLPWLRLRSSGLLRWLPRGAFYRAQALPCASAS
jgi:hypothetical protein